MKKYYWSELFTNIKGRLSNRIAPSWLVLNIDLWISFLAILSAYLLRFNFAIPYEYKVRLLPSILLVIVIKAIFFYYSRLHVSILRYTSIRDLFKLFIVVFLSDFVILGLNFLHSIYIGSSTFYIPTSILIIDFFISVYVMVFFRMLIKIIFSEIKGNNTSKINTIIYGVDELAISVKRALDLDPNSSYKFVGFIDNDPGTHNKKLEGVEIYNYKKIEFVIKKFSVKTLIIAKPTLSPALKNHIIEKSLKHGVKVMSVNDIKSWLSGGIDLRKIRSIRIEDLLEREPITLDVTQIKKQLEGKTILVTGAAGSIGSEIVRQVCNFSPSKVILFDNGETPLHNIEMELSTINHGIKVEFLLGDITNQSDLKRLFNSHKIDIIYHAAAYKHVPIMERHPAKAIRNNIFGTKLLADMALKYKVPKFIMISTDKAVNPTNVMGASKRIAEMYTQSLNEFNITSFITTRFGNVLGSNGSVIPLFKKQIENGGPITVTDPEVCRYFMTIPEACQLVLEAGTMGKGGEIFIFDMGKSVKIVDLAKNMIRLAGLTPGKDIEIKFVGLRPGEKLYEELLAKEENTIPTYHPKILIAKVKPCKYDNISLKVDELIKISENVDNMQIVAMMKEIVPEYKSQNSVYNVLDINNKIKMPLFLNNPIIKDKN